MLRTRLLATPATATTTGLITAADVIPPTAESKANRRGVDACIKPVIESTASFADRIVTKKLFVAISARTMKHAERAIVVIC